jgi:hypothetical protein
VITESGFDFVFFEGFSSGVGHCGPHFLNFNFLIFFVCETSPTHTHNALNAVWCRRPPLYPHRVSTVFLFPSFAQKQMMPLRALITCTFVRRLRHPPKPMLAPSSCTAFPQHFPFIDHNPFLLACPDGDGGWMVMMCESSAHAYPRLLRTPPHTPPAHSSSHASCFLPPTALHMEVADCRCCHGVAAVLQHCCMQRNLRARSRQLSLSVIHCRRPNSIRRPPAPPKAPCPFCHLPT